MNYKALLIPFLGGFIYAFGFPLTWAPSFFLMPVVGMALFMSQFHIFNPQVEYHFKRELLSFFIFSFAIFLFGYYWIPYTLEQFGGIAFPLNYAVGSLFSLMVLPQYLLFFIGFYFFRKFKRPSLNYHLTNPILAFILTSFDYFIPQQFPAHIGHSWIQLAPYLGLTPIFGYSLYSFTSYWLSLSLLRRFTQKRWDPWGLVFFFAVLILNFTFPIEYSPEKQESFKINRIRMVQANVGNFLKVDSEKGGVTSKREVSRRYYKLSTRPTSQALDLIVWPETSFPELLNSEDLKKGSHELPSVLQKVIEKMDAEIFFGGYDLNTSKEMFSNFESEYNTGFLLDDKAQLKDYYHKIKLIPFGEGLPFGPFNKLLSEYVSNISFFAKGNRYTLFKLRNEATFINVICYEVLFPRFVINYMNSLKEKPHFMINLTNDSWYGKTSEPYHHLQLTKWRSLELGIPIIRMTNTGFSSILYPDGSETERIGLFKQDTLDQTLRTSKSKITLYQKYGFFNLSALFIILMGLISSVVFFTKKKS